MCSLSQSLKALNCEGGQLVPFFCDNTSKITNIDNLNKTWAGVLPGPQGSYRVIKGHMGSYIQPPYLQGCKGLFKALLWPMTRSI